MESVEKSLKIKSVFIVYPFISTNIFVEFVKGGCYKYLKSRSMWQGNVALIKTFFFYSIFSFMKKDCQEKAFNKVTGEGLSVLMLDSLFF